MRRSPVVEGPVGDAELEEPTTPEAARAWLRRWRLVEARQIDELRAMTPQQKFDQLVDLFDFAREFETTTTDAEDAAVRARWKRLRLHARP